MERCALAAFVLFSALSYISASSDWWEDASLYQIYPRSWKDSDGNGIGDLKGITENLDYLKEIGITPTWLSPIFKSPMADNGYDVSNFTDIDPVFGTLEDFDALMMKAKEIGVKIILDFVPNHSSDKCEWFVKSVNREDGYDNFYVWADGVKDPNNPDMILPPSNWVSLFTGSMWTWNDKRQQFYLHTFLKEQPDLNFRNPKVRKTMLDVLKFWLERGVDGFRIDAVPHIFEKVNEDGTYPDEPLSSIDPDKRYLPSPLKIYTFDQPETFELLYEWRAFLDSFKEEHGGDTRILLAEAYSPIEDIDKFFGNATHKGVHIPFNFQLMNLNELSNARDVENAANSWMEVMWRKHQTANWVLGNHDNSRIANRFGLQRKDLINVILASLPGVTVTYYGEEIGMVDVETCKSCVAADQRREFVRTPFQWNKNTSAGFSSTNRTWLPVADNYKNVNVESQRGIPRSTLNIFKAMQQLKRTPGFKAFKNPGGWGYVAVSENVFQIVRSGSGEEYRILANFGNETEDIGPLIASEEDANASFEYILGTIYSPHSVGDKAILKDITLKPFEAVVLKKDNRE